MLDTIPQIVGALLRPETPTTSVDLTTAIAVIQAAIVVVAEEQHAIHTSVVNFQPAYGAFPTGGQPLPHQRSDIANLNAINNHTWQVAHPQRQRLLPPSKRDV